MENDTKTEEIICKKSSYEQMVQCSSIINGEQCNYLLMPSSSNHGEDIICQKCANNSSSFNAGDTSSSNSIITTIKTEDPDQSSSSI